WTPTVAWAESVCRWRSASSRPATGSSASGTTRCSESGTAPPAQSNASTLTGARSPSRPTADRRWNSTGATPNPGISVPPSPPPGPRHEARPQIERTQLTPEARLHLRLLEQQRCALKKTHDTAQRRLSAAERDLQRPNPLRRRHRDKLRTEIELRRRAVELVN